MSRFASLCLAILLGLSVGVLAPRYRRHKGLPGTFLNDVLILWNNRYLFWIWLGFRIRVRYAQTFLGILWIIVLPLATSLVIHFALSIVLGIASLSGVPYVPFFMVGQVSYNFFSNTLLQSRGGIMQVIATAQQVYFPRSLAILLVVGESLVDFFFTFLALLIVIVVSGIPLSGWALAAALPLLLLILLTTGLSFGIAWYSFQIRDFQQLLSVILQLLFYLLPIIYPADRVPAPYNLILHVNPLTALIEALRDTLLYQRPPDLVSLIYPALWAALALYWGSLYFRANEDRFADYL